MPHQRIPSVCDPSQQRRALDGILTDKRRFVEIAKTRFAQHSAGSGVVPVGDATDAASRLFKEYQARPPPVDDLQLVARNYSNGADEMNLDQFGRFYYRMLRRIREKYFPDRLVLVTREELVGVFQLDSDESIKNIYSFVKELGEGGFGKVHLVKDRKSGAMRACKEILKDEWPVALILDEIKALMRLDHPNVLKIHDFYDSTDRVYIVTEMCGGTLHSIISEVRRLQESIVKGIMYQILLGLNYVHQSGYVHKDLKPQNILFVDGAEYGVDKESGHVAPEGYTGEFDKKANLWSCGRIMQLCSGERACSDETEDVVLHDESDFGRLSRLSPDAVDSLRIKIIDFGLAEYGVDKTSGYAAGTPGYMAPEVYMGECDKKADLWSCGCIMFYLCSGEHAFYGETEDEIEDVVIHDEPDFERLTHLSPGALDLLRQLLAKKPKKRLDARKALQHPWFAARRARRAADLVEGMSMDIQENLKSFMRLPPLRSALLNVMAHQLDEDSQIRHITRLFGNFDSDENGVLSYAEVTHGLNLAGFPECHVNRILQAIDVNGSGVVSFTEFLAGCYSWTGRDLNLLWSAFMKFNRRQDGRIGFEEFRQLLAGSQRTRGLTEVAVKKMFDEIDRDCSGFIEWRDIEAYMSRQ